MSDKPTTRTVSITDIADQLPRLLDGVARHETRVVVEQDGRPVAALIAFDDLQGIARAAHDQADPFAVIDRIRAAFADVPPEEIEQEAERVVSSVRRRRNVPVTRSA